MPTRNVVLTDSQAQFVEQLVTTGRYQNASEVLREGLRLVQAREQEHDARLSALRDAAAIGIADMDEGLFITFESPEELNRRLDALATQAIDGT